MEKVGLVLEGGAMRGVYTAGVLDFFLKKELEFPYVCGVSAGACQAFSYISKQVGRNKEINLSYVKDSRYLSLRNLAKGGNVFGFSFFFDDIANKLVPFDFDAFQSSPQEFAIGVTNCATGKAEYFYKSQNDVATMFQACQASSSMPLAAKETKIKGRKYMDGGIAAPIPICKAMSDGYERNVIVLTRNEGYRKKSSDKSRRLTAALYPNDPGLVCAVGDRPKVYNETIEYIEELEKQGKVFIIRPKAPVRVHRMEKNRRKLFEFYKEGYQNAAVKYQELCRWLKNEVI